MKQLHVISNGKLPYERFLSIVESIHPYVSAIHLREKRASDTELDQWIQGMIHKGIPKQKIIINSRSELAGRYKLGGVHLPAHYGSLQEIKQKYPFLKVGVSVHQLSEALYYQETGADYLFFGNVYETTCKPGLAGKGLETLSAIITSVSIPVIAIGGVIPARVPELFEQGASGMAVMSGIMEAKDPLEAVKDYQAYHIQKEV
ncbi:thiazole tautomerase (transcriptional regulator TenI) [Pullulanibacillus pueri]|uniref:Thiamine phosphate synthase n=1 Tax=Pullulanibacillus pueri TaxID=1437324 RepID=A0A8J3ELT7_9BACL|nr:thiamine phosphate synthase [Pullulanibacillus pueri]MBM7681284.1 thiazole tautomerase (transcriptional regulator TenI) [Pullulanibacillus pueri]GGH77747.1 thiamine phosphate synthase [Pullulanibacillus pueri]